MKKLLLPIVLGMASVAAFGQTVTSMEFTYISDVSSEKDGYRIHYFDNGELCVPSRHAETVGGVPGFILTACNKLNTTLALDVSNKLGVVPGTFATPANVATAVSTISLTPGPTGATGATGPAGAAGVSPIVNRARITTASDGTYAWTYPTACPSATVPIIQITPEGSASTTYNTVIVGAPTNTAASIKITQVTDVVLLGIHVLGVAPASATVVHLTAVCP